MDGNALAYVVSSAVDDDHGSVIEITDALVWLFSEALNFDFHRLAGFHEGFEGIGKGVEVDDPNAFNAGKLHL